MDIHLDNTAFSLLSCDYKFQSMVVKGIKPSSSSAADFGDLVHKALEYRDHGLSQQEITDKLLATESPAQVPKVFTTLSFLSPKLSLPPPITLLDNKPALEVKFKHRYAQMMIPNSNELLNVYLEGTIDRIYLDKDVLVISDYKTTGAGTPYSIDKILKGYALSFQLPFYFYALLNFFDGILPASYKEYLTSHHYRTEIILITHNTNPPSIQKYIRPAFNDDMISREIPMIIHNKISQAINIASMTSQAAKTGFTVYKACDDCAFRPACLSSGTTRETDIISSFPVKPYNPLAFR